MMKLKKSTPHTHNLPLVFQAVSTYEEFNISRGDCLIVGSHFYRFGDLVAIRYGRSHHLGLFAACGEFRYLIQPKRVMRLPPSARVLGTIRNLDA